jgi:hypothetical protein
MTDPDLGVALTPEETHYFETGGGESAPADAAARDTDGAPPAPPQAEKMVALAALHEERSRRKEIDRQNRDLQQQLAEMRGKFSIIERLRPQGLSPGARDDADDGLAGAVRDASHTVAQIERRLQAQDAHERAADQQTALVSAYQADAAQFEARTPDFRAAYNHLLQSRAQELVALGYDTPQAIHDALLADEFAVAQAALARRQSPAELIYNLARQRGYAAGAPRGSDRLDTIARGQAANKSLAFTGGGSGDADITAEALLKMPMDEFDAWCTRNPAKARRIMGG